MNEHVCIKVSVSYVFWPPLDFFLRAGSLSNKIAEERYIIIPYSLKQGLLPDRSRLSREDKLECLCMCVSRQIPRSSSKHPNPRRPPNRYSGDAQSQCSLISAPPQVRRPKSDLIKCCAAPRRLLTLLFSQAALRNCRTRPLKLK